MLLLVVLPLLQLNLNLTGEYYYIIIFHIYFNKFIISHSDGTDIREVLSYLYFISYTVCLVTALIVLTQSTIVTMFGPSKALKGDTSDAVKEASENMRQQQWMVLMIGKNISLISQLTILINMFSLLMSQALYQ